MKKFIALVLLFGLAVVALPPLARATTTLPNGEYAASIIDRSSLFSNQDTDLFLEPEVPGQSIDVGDEQRTIFKVDGINTGVKQLLGDGTKTVVEDGGSIPIINGLLSGMLYDLEIARIVNQTTGASVATLTNPVSGSSAPYHIEKGSAGGYSSTGGSAGTWTDTVGNLLVSNFVNGVHYGGILVIYEDPALNTSFTGDGAANPPIGPADWREPGDLTGVSPYPTGNMDVPGVLTNAAYYPTISDVPGSNTGVKDSGTAEPWLVLALVDLYDIPAHGVFGANPFGVAGSTFLLEQDVVLTAGQGIKVSGVAFGNVLGGTAAGMFNLGNFSIFSDDGTVKWLADMRIEFEGENVLAAGGYDDWQIDSDDPAMFGVGVPEPATLSLFGMALLSLPGLYYRRKRK